MTDDPIVAEVHRVRAETARRFGNDLRAYGRFLQEWERRHPGGTVVLSGTNTYTGTTDVSAFLPVNPATLLVNGDNSGATGIVQVSGSGSVLGGTGTIGGNVYTFSSTITGGTTTGVGTLTLQQNLNLRTGEGDGTYLANLSGSLSDLLAITGNLNLGGQTTLNIVGSADGITTYTLATFGTRTDMFQTVTGIPTGYALVYNTGDIELVPIPEPATWLGAGFAVAALLWTQRRRFAKRA